MNSWERHFNEHELWTTIASLAEEAREVEQPEVEDGRDTLTYLLSVVDHVAARRENVLPLMVAPPMLAATATAAQQVRDYLAGWLEGTYNNAQMDNVIEQLVQSMATWPPATPEQLAKAVKTASSDIGSSTEQALDSVRSKRDELVAALAELKSSQGSLGERISEQTQAITNAIATFESSSQERLDTSKQRWEDERQKQATSAEDRLKTLADLEQQAREMVGAATRSTVATNYGKYARNKTVAAWICDIAAAVIGSVGVAAIIYHLYSDQAGDDGVGLSLTRLAASLGVLGIAALVAHRGGEHHAEARAAKRADLATSRVGPFISHLPEEARVRILLEVTDRVFVRGQLDETSGPNPVSAPRSILDRFLPSRQPTDDDPPATP